MRGTHTGYSFYGEPTGKRINVLGVSHHLIRTVGFNASGHCLIVSLLKQLYRPA
ncbi:MAG UNVERIFIED_CONTAM: hypothetical protein LVT10_07040 [Anaerolineae bacterium]|jgi:hypothetical protein